jgi:group II intron reverse transcriptase/maturase
VKLLIERYVFELSRFVSCHPNERVDNLINKINRTTLREIHKQLANKKSKGLDGISKSEYGIDFRENVGSLLNRISDGSYRPKPLKRVYIPKHGNKKRPLGIICYEDKLVASNVAKLLSAIYEPKFMDFSYGFRLNRNCHSAIISLRKIIMNSSSNYVVESDIKSFFDTIDHKWLCKFLQNDIADDRFIGIIKKFLKVGIVEKGRFTSSNNGTPQGNTISPILANIYLHYAVDLWFEKCVKRNCSGDSSIIRYADDFVGVFEYRRDAEMFLDGLNYRLQKFSLEISLEKTKMLDIRRPVSFSFLGLTFVCDKPVVSLCTDESVLSEKIQNLKMVVQKCRYHSQRKMISRINSILIGHYNYYGFSTNIKAMLKFRKMVKRTLLEEIDAGSLSINKKVLQYLKRPKIHIKIY